MKFEEFVSKYRQKGLTKFQIYLYIYIYYQDSFYFKVLFTRMWGEENFIFR